MRTASIVRAKESLDRSHGGWKWFVPPDELPVLIQGRLPAYISWEQYLENQEQLRQNRALKGSRGAPGEARPC